MYTSFPDTRPVSHLYVLTSRHRSTFIPGIVEYVALSYCLLTLSSVRVSFLHVFSWLDSSFPFSAE